jgi:glucose-6-phosphate 1-epimerase
MIDEVPDAARLAVPGCIEFEQSPLGGPVMRLINGTQQALVALHGAQVLNWTVDGEGLLWLASVARIRAGKGIRGGIPVCWPWFADHPTDTAKPAHGFVRHRAWAVKSTDADADGVSVTLCTATTPGDVSFWPHQAEATVKITLGEGLDVSLSTRNTGSEAFPLTQALHTYFRISDIGHIEVQGLEGHAYLDKLDGFSRKTQDGPIAVSAEVDRIYLGNAPAIILLDKGSGRRLSITGKGSDSTVVWNPWTAKTARLGDMGSPDAFRQMLCIETANAGDDIVTLPPGREHVLLASYRLEA